MSSLRYEVTCNGALIARFRTMSHALVFQVAMEERDMDSSYQVKEAGGRVWKKERLTTTHKSPSR